MFRKWTRFVPVWLWDLKCLESLTKEKGEGRFIKLLGYTLNYIYICGGLNMLGPENATVRGCGLVRVGVVLLEEACHLLWGLKVQNPMPAPSLSPSACCLGMRTEPSNTAQVPCMPPRWQWTIRLCSCKQAPTKCFLLWPWCLFSAIEEWLRQKLTPGNGVLLWQARPDHASCWLYNKTRKVVQLLKGI